VQGQVVGLLGDPLPHWVGGNAQEIDPRSGSLWPGEGRQRLCPP
jgi:hypothetical protein